MAREQCGAVSGASSRVTGESQAVSGGRAAERGCHLWQGAEPKCNQEPCLSWLLAAGAGEGLGTPSGHCWQGLAALRCSSAGAAAPCGAVSVPKGEMCVGSFPSTGMAVRARAVLSLGWSFCSLQPAPSPGWSCTSLPACFKFFPALKLRC